MNTILDEIVESRLDNFKKQASTSLLDSRGKKLSLIKQLTAIKGKRVGIIAELKKASPSHGSFACDAIEPRLKAYDACGVQAISVLTEPSYFHGSFEDLSCAVNATSTPILCKDFIVSREQLELASKIGASVALIIVKIKESLALVDTCLDLGMEPLLEIHDEEDLDAIIPLVKSNPGLKLIGINNRNLSTLEVDLNTAIKLIPKVKNALGEDVFIISESGIKTNEDIRKVHVAGADAFLIGTQLMHQPIEDLPAVIGNLQGIN
ncbi:MAG: indole-3-glycerol phosphate synthase TrpC [Candidatus Hodarchaeota archaeon]